MTSKAYLTIDDSPSERMGDLTAFLFEKGMPAMFFCRGDRLLEYREAAVSAVKKGFVLANHAFSHQRASQKDVDWVFDEILRTEAALDEVYASAGVTKQGRFFRFPQLDRGTGGWVVDYDVYAEQDRAALLAAFADGLNVLSMERPPPESFDKKERLQQWLAEQGYVQPFSGVTHHWYNNGEIAAARDCLYTYSNCDWMLTARHLGKWPYKTVGDLKARAANDPWLWQEGSVNVLLAHDQAEIVDITIDLLDDLQQNGLEFLEVIK